MSRLLAGIDIGGTKCAVTLGLDAEDQVTILDRPQPLVFVPREFHRQLGIAIVTNCSTNKAEESGLKRMLLISECS